jgi:hypothetical protein
MKTATRQQQYRIRATAHRSLHGSVLRIISDHELLNHLHRLGLDSFARFRERASVFHGWLVPGWFLVSRRLDDNVTPSTIEAGSSTGEKAAMVNACP